MKLSAREFATVLAALRNWQRRSAAMTNADILSPEHFDESFTPLTAGEIDDLCERLNFAK